MKITLRIDTSEWAAFDALASTAQAICLCIILLGFAYILSVISRP